MKGTVKFFNQEKGFGFISGDDGKEVFVHVSALGDGVDLNEGDKVEFEVEQGDRGPKAVKVKKDSGSEEEASEVKEEASEAKEEGSEAKEEVASDEKAE